MANALNTIHSYLFGHSDLILASTITPVESAFSKRTLVHLQKRTDYCSATTYCPTGYYCVDYYWCKRYFYWWWVFVPVVCISFLVGISVYFCCRQRRHTKAAVASRPVVGTTSVPQNQQYSADPQTQNYAPPAGGPNMAYQTSAAYVPPSGSSPAGYATSGTYVPPAAQSPYPPPAAGPAYSAPPATTASLQ